MLSVAKLALGQEAYYEQQVALGLDDYYAGRGESPGLWVGVGAQGLDLVGAVEDGDLGILLAGVSPADGERLRAPARERTISVRTLDEATGVWREEAKRLAPVAGYDLVFSTPKSVSLLHALTGDEDVRRAISEAHESSWQAALGYLEAEACVVRRGRGGAIRERGEGFVAAAFRHRTSRAQDPHLHTHVIVANLARSADGKWRALDGEAILRTYRLAAGYLYESHLRQELSASLGVRWTEPVKGMAEIEGVPEEAIRAFSTRRQSLVEHMEAMGTSGFAASRVAALATRERKEAIDLPDLRESWLVRAAEMGLGAIELRGLLERNPAIREAPAIHSEDLTAHQATITTPELVRAVAGAARDGASVETVLAAVEELVRRPEFTRVGDDASPGWPTRFTTRSLLELEQQALRVALFGCDAGAPCADAASVAMALGDSPVFLSDEQRALVEATALSRDRVVCVEGAAGAGKTTALRVLGDALARSAVPVLGAAPSGRAADELRRATDFPAQTLHSLLADARRSGGLPRGCVLVIDEAGMAETRVLAPVLLLVEEAGGKAVLVGDPAQLPAVGAGGIYATFCERLGAERLVENRRQLEVAEREALARLRCGDAEGYLGHAAREGRLLVADDATQVKQRLLADWWGAAAEGDLRDTVMLAHRRVDVRDLNEGARALLRGAGQLGERALVVGDREYRAGDRVVCRRNDPTLGVRNGTRGSVREVDPVLGIVTLQPDGGTARQLPARYAAEHLEHGYAFTGHATQGASVERSFVLVRAEGALAEWGYVAASRARAETRLYAVGPELAADAGLARDASDLTGRRLAGALSRSAAEPPALVRLGTAGAGEHARLLGELARGGPPDPTPELRRLEAERARLGADLARAEAEHQRAGRALAQIGRFRRLGRAGQGEAARHERAAVEAAMRSRDLTAALAEGERRREVLAAQSAGRERWHQDRLQQILVRLEATERDPAALVHREGATSAPLAGRPGPELAAAARTLTDALGRSRPPDPRMEIARLREQWGRLERALADEDTRQQRYAERRDRPGLRLLSRSGREEGRRLDAMIARSEQVAERLIAEQAATGRKLRALQPALERWERELAPALSGRAEALEAEIARRVQARLADLEREPPAYLTIALGPRPEGSERWRHGAAAIEGYRERHGVTDPQRALGPEPEEGLRHGERRSVEREVADTRAELSYIARAQGRWNTARSEPGYERGPRHGLGHRIERGLDRGPSLGMGR